MAQSESPEVLAKKWFVLAAMGAMVYFTVVFSYVIRGNDGHAAQATDAAADAKVEHHD